MHIVKWLVIALLAAGSAIWFWYDAASERRIGRWGMPLTILSAAFAFFVFWFIWPGLADLFCF